MTRQIIEVYIRILQCRSDENSIETILKEKRQKGSTKDLLNKIKKKLDIQYIKNFDSERFLEYVLDEFYSFSNLFHISGISLSQNIWILNKEKNQTRAYIEDPNLKEGENLIVFIKKSAFPNEEIYFHIIHQFYTFSGLCLTELELLKEKTKRENEN